MKVMVTGGTGFVGSHATAALMRAGHDVRLLVRRPDQVPRSFAPFGVEPTDIVVGDILDDAAIGRAVEGCDAVTHRARPFVDTIADQIAWMARAGRIPARRAGVLAGR